MDDVLGKVLSLFGGVFRLGATTGLNTKFFSVESSLVPAMKSIVTSIRYNIINTEIPLKLMVIW